MLTKKLILKIQFKHTMFVQRGLNKTAVLFWWVLKMLTVVRNGATFASLSVIWIKLVVFEFLLHYNNFDYIIDVLKVI